MTLKIQNFLFLVFFIFSVKSEEGYERRLATKTPYRFVSNYNDNLIEYEGCTPKKVWGFVRHGTRYPSTDDIDDMRIRLTTVRDLIESNFPVGPDETSKFSNNTIDDTTLDLFTWWEPQVVLEDDEKLTIEGEEELFLMAQRYQNRLPSLLTDTYTDSIYRFKYAISQRTEKSCKSFTDGLFGANVTEIIDFPAPDEIDPILEYYKLCTKYQEEVDDNPDASIEKTNFENGAEVLQTVDNVNTRLGFENGELEYNDIHAMYKTCAFETAWNKTQKSPWCSAFSIDDFKILEYVEDLDYYWTHGYGFEITYKQACVVVNDLVDFFQNGGQTSSLYFTHSGAVVKLLAYLGLYNDQHPLLADEFAQNSDRKYRVSYIDSFANNIFFVLFDCNGREKILTLHQERIVRLPGCPEDDLCDLETFVDYYASSECNFDEICANFDK